MLVAISFPIGDFKAAYVRKNTDATMLDIARMCSSLAKVVPTHGIKTIAELAVRMLPGLDDTIAFVMPFKNYESFPGVQNVTFIEFEKDGLVWIDTPSKTLCFMVKELDNLMAKINHVTKNWR